MNILSYNEYQKLLLSNLVYIDQSGIIYLAVNLNGIDVFQKDY